jgi:hypothetical protein
MNSQTMRRLERLEASTGTCEERIRVEHYDLSEKGELIRLPDPSSVPEDDRPAQKTIQVILVDSDGNGGPGPRYLAYQRRIRASYAGAAA